MTALPPEVYLIGYGGDVAMQGEASKRSMGFKAWNLLRMAWLSLPVPVAFVIGTRYCADPAGRAGADLWRAGLRLLERSTAQALGDARRPLLPSVRSGAPVHRARGDRFRRIPPGSSAAPSRPSSPPGNRPGRASTGV